jgi:hypothetical protein
MFKHPHCNGYHSTAGEARMCQFGTLSVEARTTPTRVPPKSNNQDSPPLAKLKSEALSRSERSACLVRPVQTAAEGFYRTPDGDYYKVIMALHGSGRPYAKRLEVVSHAVKSPDGTFLRPAETRWVMAKAWVYKLKPEWKLGVEEAGEFGRLYGQCIKCHLPLTKEESIARGMGDICAGVAGSKKQRATAERIWRSTK